MFHSIACFCAMQKPFMSCSPICNSLSVHVFWRSYPSNLCRDPCHERFMFSSSGFTALILYLSVPSILSSSFNEGDMSLLSFFQLVQHHLLKRFFLLFVSGNLIKYQLIVNSEVSSLFLILWGNSIQFIISLVCN